MGEREKAVVGGSPGPWRPLFIILATVFAAEAFFMFLLHKVITGLTETQEMALDATFETLVIAPVLFFVVYRPFKKQFEELHTAAAAQQESEQRLETLVNAMPEAVYFKDGAGRWLFVNPAGLKPFQLENIDYRGKTDAELGEMVPFHREALLYCQRTDANTWDVGRPSYAEEAIPQPSGPPVIFDTAKLPLFNPDGSRKGLIVMGTDITESRKTEEERFRLAIAVEQAADAIMITDLDGAIQYVNPAFERITGYAKSEVIGKNPRLLSGKKQTPETYRAMWTALLRGETWNGRLVNRTKNGELFEVEATLSPIRSAAGTITNFVAVERDVTREVLLTNAREYFTTVTSHELYTPLTKLKMIKVYLGNLRPFLSDESKLDEAGALLSNVYAEFERIITATTFFTTLNSPGPKEPFRPVYLFPEFMEVIEAASDAAMREKRKVVLDVQLDPLPKDVVVSGDRDMLERCLKEILSNAIKYTPDGGSVRISGKVEGDKIVLEVKDTGIGIPEEKRKMAFEPFFSFENPGYHSTGLYKFKGGGLGLGLTIALMILEYHGGTLAIESPGEKMGTTATIRLPLGKMI
ncbi:MAG: PAS domain S-box protein [Nitrospinae bacterium]|nr:PAS domain S-box protein [Nitrospinota bacterium]